MNFLKLKRGKSEKKDKKNKRKKDKIPESGSINVSSSSIEVAKPATNQPVQEKRDNEVNVKVKKNEKEISSTTSSPSSEQLLNSKNTPTPTSGNALTNTKKDNNHAHASKQTISSNEIQGSDNNDDDRSKSEGDDINQPKSEIHKNINDNKNNDDDIIQGTQEGESNDNNNNDDDIIGAVQEDKNDNEDDIIEVVQEDKNDDENDIIEVVQEDKNDDEDDIIEAVQEDKNDEDDIIEVVQEDKNNEDDIIEVVQEDKNNDEDDITEVIPKSTKNVSNGKLSKKSLGNAAGKAALQIFSTSLLAAKPFFPWIESVTSVINEITNQYELVEYNKKTCLVLVERVEMISLSVKALTRRKDENIDKFQNTEYYHSFIRLFNVLKSVKDFISDISELKGYRRFIYASEVKTKANQLLQRLEACCNDLQFSIIITSEIKEREERSFEEDITNMSKYLKSIEKGVITMNDEGKTDSKAIYEEISVIRQMVTEIRDSKTSFNAPKIEPRDLHESNSLKIEPGDLHESNSSEKKTNVFKKLLRNTIPVACIKPVKEVEKMKVHLSILKSIQPSNKIIKFHGISKVDNGFDVLVFEWAEHGNLKKLYENLKPLNWIEKLNIAHDIASGLIFLHACKIFHHDIKCENILITGELRYEAKIANFKQSRELYGDSNRVATCDTIIRWLAPEKVPLGPEVPSPNRYTFRCEIFSFAMLLWELGSQKFPYKDMDVNEVINHVMAKKREKFDTFNSNNGLSPDSDKSIIKGFRRIIESGWEHEPDQRPTINDIYQELDGLVEIYSPRMRSKSPSNDTITNAPSGTPITPAEPELEAIERILSLEEGLEAHRRGEREKAWKCFEIHSILGDSKATHWMAYYYYKGYHVEQNINKAVQYFKQAADSNVPEGQYYYASILSKAKKPRFMEYLTNAAENGEPRALYELGRIYCDGNGVEVNEEKGIKYLQLSALKENTSAIKYLEKIDPSLLIVSNIKVKAPDKTDKKDKMSSSIKIT